MTVGDLIKRLSMVDKDLPVYLTNDGLPAPLEASEWQLIELGVRGSKLFYIEDGDFVEDEDDRYKFTKESFYTTQMALVIDVLYSHQY